MTDLFDWRRAIADLPAPPDPIGFTPRDPTVPAIEEARGARLTRQIAELREYKAKVYELIERLRGVEDVPPEVRKRLAETHAHAGHALRQYLWRERNFLEPEHRKGIGVTLHLQPAEIAVLDWIARHLYYSNPIGPEDEPTNFVPSRAQAVRELIERYVGRWEGRIPLDDLIDRQEDWGRFWVREASWRRASVRRKCLGEVHPPSMPRLSAPIEDRALDKYVADIGI